MKCCESPITSTVADNASVKPAMPIRPTDVMQAVLFSDILKPLTAALGPVGEAVTSSVVQTLFVRPRS